MTDYAFRVFERSHGRVKLHKHKAASKQLKLVCLVCGHKYKIKQASVKDIPCKKCKARTLELSFTTQKLLPKLAGLHWTRQQIAKFLHLTIGKIPDKPTPIDSTGLRVLVFDPGAVNFGVFAGELQGDANGQLKTIKVLESRLFIATFDRINNENSQQLIANLLFEVTSLHNKYTPDVVLMERYQARGGFSSSNHETVNLMIGAMMAHLQFNTQSLVRLIPASGWKIQVNKVLDLKAAYIKYKGIVLPHQLDAFLMAISLWPSAKGSAYELLRGKTLDKYAQQLHEKTWQIGASK